MTFRGVSRRTGAIAILLGAVAPALTACVSTEAYPEGWAPLPGEQPTDCHVADGLYANRPADAPGNSRLSQHLSIDGRADFIQLSTDSQGGLTIAAVRHGEVIAERSLANGAHRSLCKAGWLLFDTSGWMSSPAGAGFQSKVVGLLFANGHLVVKRRDSFAGWAYILPAIGSDESWHRYRWLGEADLEAMKNAALERHKQAKPYH